MKNLIGAGVTLHLNNADNNYSKMNKANCAACTIQTGDTKLNVYLNHATKGANERGQAVPFSHYLKQLCIVKTSHGAFRKDLTRKLPTLDELYYGHTETTLYHVFVVLDMTLLALDAGEAQLFVIVLSKTDPKDFEVFTPRRMVRFNQQDKFGSKLIRAPMFDKKSREEKIIQAAKKEEAIEHCNEKFELEMENEMLKQKLAELQSRDQEQVAKISDLTEVVQAVSTELEELKASIKRMQQDALPLEAIEYQSDDSLNEKFMTSLKIEAKANQISDGFIIAYESNIMKRFNYLLSKQVDDIPLKWKVSVVASQVIRELKEIRFKGNKQIIALYKIEMDSDTKEIKKICDTASIDDSLPRPLKSKSFVTMCYEEICLQNCDFNIHAAEFLANYATKNNLAWKAGGTDEQKKRTIKQGAIEYRRSQLRKKERNFQLSQELKASGYSADINDGERELSQLPSVQRLNRPLVT